jgi:glutamate synthase domain-containing protein 3
LFQIYYLHLQSLAVQFALETTPLADNVPLIMQRYQASTSSNPFQLPWSMRGLLEEHVVKTELDKETTELLQQFDQWKPSTKVLKDVKYRLEAVKSKL